MEKDQIVVPLFVALGLLLVVFVPFGFVWSLNTLLGLSTPYNVTTWLAAALIISILRMPNINR